MVAADAVTSGTAPKLLAPTKCFGDNFCQFVSWVMVSNHPIPLKYTRKNPSVGSKNLFILGVHLRAMVFRIKRLRQRLLHPTFNDEANLANMFGIGLEISENLEL